MKYIFLTIVILYAFVTCLSGKHEYVAKDIELWKNTEVWDFAKCVSNNQFEKAGQLINKYHIDVDFREPKFGESLLSWAVLNENIDAVKFLIGHGADPNLHNTYNGDSPMVDAAGSFDSGEILKYLLAHGGNPNDYVKSSEKLTYGRTRYTPLGNAVIVSLKKTKMLIEAGADPNFASENGMTPFYWASHRLDVLEYLLLNCDLDYKKTYIVTKDTNDTLYLKELVVNNKVEYQQDSIRVRRILKVIDKKLSNIH